MKSILLVGLSLFSINALAEPLRFVLPCAAYQYSEYKEGEIQERLPVNHAEAKSYQLVKVASKVADPKPDQPKWETSYQIEVTLKDNSTVVFPLEHGGSGDEDYNEYDFKEGYEADLERLWLSPSGGTIQNSFEWGHFAGQDSNGKNVFYECEQ